MLTQQEIAAIRKKYNYTPKSSIQQINNNQTLQNTSLLQKYGSSIANNIQQTKEVGIGAAKGLISTLTNTSSLGERMLKGIGRALTPKSLEKTFGFEQTPQTAAQQLVPQRLRTPQGAAQNVGFYAEQIAEFLAPSSKIAKLETGMKLLPKMATEALAAGGQTALQQGKIDNNTKTAAIVGAMFPFAGALLSSAKTPLRAIGEKIQTTVIRPTSRDFKDGFNIKNVNKFNLGGTLEQTAIKTHTKLNELSQQLSNKLKSSNSFVNLNKVFKETADEILGVSKSKQFGDIAATKRVIQNLKSEIEAVAGKNGLVDLVEATNIKRGAGTKGAWAFGRIEPDATAIENVYSNFYSKLKNAINKVAPEEVATINKELSELIPISNAVIRRLPVAQRNNVISLTDSIGLFSAIFDPRALALIGANRLSKSGTFGNFLVKVAQQKNPTTSIGKRVFGGKLNDVGDIGASIKYVDDKGNKILFPKTNPAVGQTAETSLFQEAKKYKSAEEFVKAQVNIAEYSPLDTHNTQRAIELLNESGIPVKSGEDVLTLYHGTNAKGMKGIQESGTLNPFSYMATNKVASEGFAFGKGGGVIEIKVPVKDAGFVQIPMAGKGGATIQNPVKLIRGEDGIWRAEQWKTKSQLTDIWNKANTSKPLAETSLIQEAKKYKSAEEFVKAQPVVYHGTSANLKTFNNKQGTFFTDDYMNAEGYAGGENVYEGVLDFKNPFIIDAKGRLYNDLKTPYGKSTQEIVGKIDSKKYDGVIFKNIKDSWIDDADVQDPSTIYYAFKPKDSFLNESQLIDIWNKAHKTN